MCFATLKVAILSGAKYLVAVIPVLPTHKRFFDCGLGMALG
jgi:hypothetical protein